MHRVSEFEWRGYRTPRRRLWPLFLVGAGLTIAYFFFQPDHASAPEPFDRTASNLATGNPDLAQNETSAIASAAPSNQPETAQNEASAITGAPSRVEVINSPPTEASPPPEAQISSSETEDDGKSIAPSYSALRRQLLRHLR
jgi:hypothetical protein